MVGFDVRKVILNDYEDIAKLNSKVDYLDLKAICNDKNTLMVVAQLNDDVIGYVKGNFIREAYNIEVDVEDLIVDEMYRGLGVGHQLVLELEKCIKGGSVRYITTINRNYDDEKVKFFNRQGFTLYNNSRFIKLNLI